MDGFDSTELQRSLDKLSNVIQEGLTILCSEMSENGSTQNVTLERLADLLEKLVEINTEESLAITNLTEPGFMSKPSSTNGQVLCSICRASMVGDD